MDRGTHIYSNQKQAGFHQKSPWTPMSQLSPVCTGITRSLFLFCTFCICEVMFYQKKSAKQFHIYCIALLECAFSILLLPHRNNKATAYHIKRGPQYPIAPNLCN